ncbi:MAG TPA: MBL fold metallo-hydrolase [Streptosporangiaceae bacterium]|nr:MBL fold metallo-hydrolase [Streptosporangiaceae bacterium]
MKLLPGLHLAGGGRLGPGLTNPYDCNVYLLTAGRQALVVDSGCGLDTGDLAGRIMSQADGRPVAGILLTHAHADHAGGAAELAGLLSTNVYAGNRTARLVAAGDHDQLGLTRAIRAGVYPPGYRFPPAPVVCDAADLLAGLTEIRAEALPAPGHSRDHTCYLVEAGQYRYLLSGDLVFARGRIALLGTDDADIPALHDSLAEMRRREPDVLLPGHGVPVLADACWHLDQALHEFELGRIPMSFQ